MTNNDIARCLDVQADKFLDLFDKQLADKLRGKFYFAGGCIYSLHNDKTPRDYDIFLYNDNLIEELTALPIWIIKNEYALTYGNFQIIVKYFGQPCDVVGQFDFLHNMYWYVPFSNEIIAYNYDFHYLDTNELIFNENRARDIEGVYLRIEKFLERGMTISKETRKKIKKRTTKKAVKEYKKTRIKRGCHS